MLKIENTEVVGWEAAIRGMRNPMNSWGKSDSEFGCIFDDKLMRCNTCSLSELACDDHVVRAIFNIGPNDYKLMTCLRNAGTDHRKFMRMITVYLDITAPLYWWKEFDTYKVGTAANSCSTMHKIAAKEFTLEDFSCEHLLRIDPSDEKVNLVLENFTVDCSGSKDESSVYSPFGLLNVTIEMLNKCRERYLVALKTEEETGLPAKDIWWQLIQLLPSSYNQRRTVMLNYEVLANIYKSRRNHKLDEWHTFCNWTENLPYSELITGAEVKSDVS